MAQRIKQLISQGEGTTTEFKESFDREAVETAGAFANTQGGVILVGVSDKSGIKGISVGKETLRNWSNQISQATEPRVIPEVESAEIDGKQVAVIRIKEFPIKPVSVRGRCYKRVGNSNRVMSPQEIAQMHLLATRQSWDGLVVAGASLDDIDEQKVQWYLARREKVRNVTTPQDMSVTQLLINIGGIDSERHAPTYAGILFFGKSPQQFCRNAELRLVRFKGIDVTHPVIDRSDCKDTLWEMVTQAEDFIRKNIRLLSFRNSTRFQRTDKFEYPLDALREAIINGLIHRNYTESSDVRVFIFDDRIEIINPGSFPEGVSPDEPIHKPVNPILSQFMYDVGFIERYGSGIKMMRRLCQEWGNKAPRYDLHPLETRAIFDSPVQESSYVEIADITEQLNERQKKALLYATMKGVITRREYMTINSVSHKTAYSDLIDMMEKGLLEREGSGRSARYKVKKSEDEKAEDESDHN